MLDHLAAQLDQGGLAGPAGAGADLGVDPNAPRPSPREAPSTRVRGLAGHLHRPVGILLVGDHDHGEHHAHGGAAGPGPGLDELGGDAELGIPPSSSRPAPGPEAPRWAWCSPWSWSSTRSRLTGAMGMAREASHEHPARVLGVILGYGAATRRSTPRSAPARLDRRDRFDQAERRGGQASRLGRAALVAAGLSRRGVVADRPTGEPGRGPARRPRAAPDHRLRERQPGGAPRCATVQGLHARQHRPGVDPAHPVACPARGRTRPASAQGHGGHVFAERVNPARPAHGLAADGSRSTIEAQDSRPGVTEVALDTARGRSASPGPTAGWRRTPPPGTRTGRSGSPSRGSRAVRRGAAPARRGRRLRRGGEDADQEQVAVTAPGTPPRIEVHESADALATAIAGGCSTRLTEPRSAATSRRSPSPAAPSPTPSTRAGPSLARVGGRLVARRRLVGRRAVRRAGVGRP